MFPADLHFGRHISIPLRLRLVLAQLLPGTQHMGIHKGKERAKCHAVFLNLMIIRLNQSNLFPVTMATCHPFDESLFKNFGFYHIRVS